MAFTKVLPAGLSTTSTLTVDSLDSVGAISASSITATTGTFSGDLNVAGVLTYEDVTNVDSIGLVTARSGIHVTGGSVGIGTDNPGASLQITANSPGILFQDANSGSTESKIEGLSGHLYYTTDNVNRDHIFSATGESEALRITGDGNVGIGSDNPQSKLDVDGNTRIVGILTVGSASSTTTTTIDGSQDFPTIRPTLDLNFAATKTLDRRITFTRDSIGTYTDEFGIIQTVPNNVPRFDHDPETGESLGLLIEERRTNYEVYSSSIHTAYTASSGTGTVIRTASTATITPDGTSTTDAIIEDTSTNTQHTIIDAVIDTFTQSTAVWTHSVFVKLISGSRLFASRIYGTGNDDVYVEYNLSTGTSSDGASANNQVISHGMDEYPNGWWRCWVSFTAPGDAEGWLLGLADGSAAELPTYDGDGTSGVYIWGAQLEEGEFPTSYIPTSGSTVTRNKDIAVIKGTNFTDVFDTNFREFSLLVDYDNSKTNDGTYYEILSFWGESTGYDDRIGITKDDQSPYHIETRAFGGGSAIFNNGLLSASSKAATQKFATSWSVPDYSNTSSRRWAFCFSGESPIDVVNDGPGTTVPAVTRLGLGISPTRLVENETGGLIHFKRFAAYNKALTDAQLQSLTRQ